jgi:hypothetical protein
MPSPATSTTRRLGLALGPALVLVLLVSGCGGSGDSGADTPGDTGSPSVAGGSPQVDPDQFQAIQDCLEAAGLGSALPSGIPSGMPSDLPSDLPSDMSGMPSDLPSDLPSDFGGFPGGGQFDDPQVQAALEACGIELPTPPSR